MLRQPRIKRFIVCGSRSWTDRTAIENRLVVLPMEAVLVHGAARGADAIAESTWLALGGKVERFPADWEKYGKRAGSIRNKDIAAAGADLCIAFRVRGKSRGTDNMQWWAEFHSIPRELIWEK